MAELKPIPFNYIAYSNPMFDMYVDIMRNLSYPNYPMLDDGSLLLDDLVSVTSSLPYVNINPEEGDINIYDYIDYDPSTSPISVYRAMQGHIPFNFSEAADNTYGWTAANDRHTQYADSINYTNRYDPYAQALHNGNKSACTLYATSMVNPNKPIASSGSINWFNNPKETGYKRIDDKDVKPGDIVIYNAMDDPRRAHTALVVGRANKRFKTTYYGKDYITEPGDLILAYTTGTTHSKGFRIIPEQIYADNNKGKDLRNFYRYTPLEEDKEEYDKFIEEEEAKREKKIPKNKRGNKLVPRKKYVRL